MSGRIILLCEDDPVIAFDLSSQIAARGDTVLGPVSSAEAALELADRHRLDGAVIDLNLADGRSGPAIAREMHGRGTPILLCSGLSLAPEELKDIKHIYVRKPFGQDALADCLDSMFATRAGAVAAV
ncbi:MAG: response regulator [Hyphomicrobiales bacterium]|nr:response regulator [Hyphomicrobiales bacterium]